MHCRMSPLSHSYLDMREKFLEPVESSKRNEGNAEIMEVLRKKWKKERRNWRDSSKSKKNS